jgi:hypothetical protein
MSELFTLEGLQIFIFIIPGLITSSFVDAIATRPRASFPRFLTEALIFTLIIMTLYSLLFDGSPVVVEKVNGKLAYTFKPLELLCLIGISIILSFIASAMISWQIHIAIAKKIKCSRGPISESVWLDVCHSLDEHDYVILNFKDGRRLWGYPALFSSNPEKGHFFLLDAAWIISEFDDDGQIHERYVDIESEGILITPEMEIVSIYIMRSAIENDRTN